MTRSTAWRWLRTLFYWGLPPLLFYLILQKIDLTEFVSRLRTADGALVAAAYTLLLPVLALGAWRWHALLKALGCGVPSFAVSFIEYWKSMAAGLLLPGSLGSDAYRVLLAGERRGAFLRAGFVVLLEKLAALTACALLLAATFPWLDAYQLPQGVKDLMRGLYFAGLAALLALLALAVLQRGSWLPRAAAWLSRQVEALAARVRPAGTPVEPASMGRTFAAAFSLRVALPALAVSLAMFALLALQAQWLFHAFGHPIGWEVNLFVTPLLIVLYALPVSFGGLGLREGAAIVAYGAFGVPAEVALAISLCGLAGNLLSYAVGASLFLGRLRQQPTIPRESLR